MNNTTYFNAKDESQEFFKSDEEVFKILVPIKYPLDQFAQETSASKNTLKYVKVSVELKKLENPLLKRIALGLAIPPLKYIRHFQPNEDYFLFENRSGRIVRYDWDEFHDLETPEMYLNRQFERMDINKILLLPREATYMQASVAMRWAHKLGFPITMSTIRKYVKRESLMLFDVQHVKTSSYYYYLNQWSKCK